MNAWLVWSLAIFMLLAPSVMLLVQRIVHSPYIKVESPATPATGCKLTSAFTGAKPASAAPLVKRPVQGRFGVVTLPGNSRALVTVDGVSVLMAYNEHPYL